MARRLIQHQIQRHFADHWNVSSYRALLGFKLVTGNCAYFDFWASTACPASYSKGKIEVGLRSSHDGGRRDDEMHSHKNYTVQPMIFSIKPVLFYEYGSHAHEVRINAVLYAARNALVSLIG
jgi:hypothetical protein